MARGRKADKGTYEARGFVQSKKFEIWLNDSGQKQEVKDRIQKAIFFGLGIKKEEKTIDKINNVFQKVIAQEEKEIVTPIKEKKAKEKERLDDVEGDEYFPQEKCYEA